MKTVQIFYGIFLSLFLWPAYSQEIKPSPISVLESLAPTITFHWVDSQEEWHQQLPSIQKRSEAKTGQVWTSEDLKNWQQQLTGITYCFQHECWIYWSRPLFLQQLESTQVGLQRMADYYEHSILSTSQSHTWTNLAKLYREDAKLLPQLYGESFTASNNEWTYWHEGAHALLHSWSLDHSSISVQQQEFLADLIGWTLANRYGSPLSLTSLISMRHDIQTLTQQQALHYQQVRLSSQNQEDLHSHDTADLLQRFITEHPAFIAHATEETIALRAINWLKAKEKLLRAKEREKQSFKLIKDLPPLTK